MPDSDCLSVTENALATAVALIAERPARLGATKLVAVDGPSGSGKTVFARQLTRRLLTGGIVTESLSTDLLATWDRPFEWWPDLESGVLQRLSIGVAGHLDTVSWNNGAPGPGPTIVVAPPDVLVLEGVSSGRRVVADRLSLLIWVDVPDPADRLERAVGRDGESSRAHLRAWQRSEAAFFAADHTRMRADLVVPG